MSKDDGCMGQVMKILWHTKPNLWELKMFCISD